MILLPQLVTHRVLTASDTEEIALPGLWSHKPTITMHRLGGGQGHSQHATQKWLQAHRVDPAAEAGRIPAWLLSGDIVGASVSVSVKWRN